MCGVQPASEKQILQILGIILGLFSSGLVFLILPLQVEEFWQHPHFQMFLI